MFLAARGWPRMDLVWWTLLGGSLAAGSANAINCYLDRDIDLLMTRTRRRPLPAHAVEPERALVFGIPAALGLRSASRALQLGEYLSLPAPQGVICYTRQLAGDRQVIVLNFTENPVTVPVTLPAVAPGACLLLSTDGTRIPGPVGLEESGWARTKGYDSTLRSPSGQPSPCPDSAPGTSRPGNRRGLGTRTGPAGAHPPGRSFRYSR